MAETAQYEDCERCGERFHGDYDRRRWLRWVEHRDGPAEVLCLSCLDTRRCAHCGATIRFNAVRLKWCTNTRRPLDTWKCGNDPDYPVRAHTPTTGE